MLAVPTSGSPEGKCLKKRNNITKEAAFAFKKSSRIIFIYCISCCVIITKVNPNLTIKENLGYMKKKSLLLALYH